MNKDEEQVIYTYIWKSEPEGIPGRSSESLEMEGWVVERDLGGEYRR